jgi:prolyl-tRNA synthetase
MYVKIDTDFHMRPGDRFFAHLQRGVPLRLELGEKDIASGTVRLVRRDTGTKTDVKTENVISEVKRTLDDIQVNLFKRAKDFRDANTHDAKSYDEFKEILESKGGFIRAYFAGTPDDEVRIREETGATPRCILPDTGTGKCIITGKSDGRLTIFAKAY